MAEMIYTMAGRLFCKDGGAIPTVISVAVAAKIAKKHSEEATS